MTDSKTTTDHKTIQRWSEERKGVPSKVAESGDGGILRIDFGKPEEGLKKISWEDFQGLRRAQTRLSLSGQDCRRQNEPLQ